jgi:hypothetical protein
VQCRECHQSPLDTINGFSAIQLNHDLGGLDLDTLRSEGLLSRDIDPADAVVPGRPDDVAALGYLHGNCGNCHRQTPPGESCVSAACGTGLQLWVDVGLVSLADTAAYRTAVNVPSGFPLPTSPGACRVHPGEPDLSTLLYRMSQRGVTAQMPPLGTEVAHAEGMDVIRTWIAGLDAPATACAPAP